MEVKEKTLIFWKIKDSTNDVKEYLNLFMMRHQRRS